MADEVVVLGKEGRVVGDADGPGSLDCQSTFVGQPRVVMQPDHRRVGRVAVAEFKFQLAPVVQLSIVLELNAP